MADRSIIPAERIEQAVLLIRDEKVMLDADLARLYGVANKALIQAVKRNLDRFPLDFMFQLTKAEFEDLRCQTGTLSLRSQIMTSRWGGRRYPPYVFTEHGVAMLSSVLKSKRAVRVNIEIMRAFVRLRKVLATNTELARRLQELEKRVGEHDDQLVTLVQAIRRMMQPPPAPTVRRMGFRPKP